MPTKGYDVHDTLAELFWGWGASLVPSEQKNFVKTLSYEVTRKPETAGTSFVGRFLDKRAKFEKVRSLTSDEMDLVQGLLECLHQRWLSDAGWDMKHGIYDHFKGGVYLSQRVERCADTGEARVSYVSMLFATAHSRRASQWNEVVAWPDGKYRSRFVYRGKDLTVAEPAFKVPSPTHTSE